MLDCVGFKINTMNSNIMQLILGVLLMDSVPAGLLTGISNLELGGRVCGEASISSQHPQC